MSRETPAQGTHVLTPINQRVYFKIADETYAVPSWMLPMFRVPTDPLLSGFYCPPNLRDKPAPPHIAPSRPSSFLTPEEVERNYNVVVRISEESGCSFYEAAQRAYIVSVMKYQFTLEKLRWVDMVCKEFEMLGSSVPRSPNPEAERDAT